MVGKHWLMKAEPDSRLEKGKDVAFSATMFEEAGVTEWDGVRNPAARNFMRDQMSIGDKALFYHSSCKVPGVAAFATISSESHPDQSVFDTAHPYYDSKSDPASPKWFCVQVQFGSHVKHFVSLKLLQHLATLDEPPSELDYLTAEHLEAIKDMTLLKKGRLSVQPVTPEAFEAIELLAERGGFDEIKLGGKAKAKAPSKKRKTSTKAEDDDDEEMTPASKPARKSRGKAKMAEPSDDESDEVMPTKRARQ